MTPFWKHNAFKTGRLPLGHFKSFYFSFSFMMAVSQGFFLPFLVSKNLSHTDIGMIMAVHTASGVAGQVATGLICDMLRQIKKVFVLWVVLLSAAMLVLYYMEAVPLFTAAIVGAAFFQSALVGLIDSWIIETDDETKERFGEIRAYGSLGWALSTAATGWMVSLCGYRVLPCLYMGFAAVLLLATGKLKDPAKSRAPVSFSGKSANLVKNVRFLHLNGIYILFYMLLGMVGMFTVILMERAGGNEFHIGLYLAIMAFSEMPMFFLARKLVRLRREADLLTLSVLLMVARIAVLLTVDHLYVLMFSGVLQAFTMPLFMVASKHLTDEMATPETRTTTQMVSVAAYLGIGAGVTSALAGFLSDFGGVRFMLVFYLGLNAVALLLSLMYSKKYYSSS